MSCKAFRVVKTVITICYYTVRYSIVSLFGVLCYYSSDLLQQGSSNNTLHFYDLWWTVWRLNSLPCSYGNKVVSSLIPSQHMKSKRKSGKSCIYSWCGHAAIRGIYMYPLGHNKIHEPGGIKHGTEIWKLVIINHRRGQIGWGSQALVSRTRTRAVH